MKWLIRVSAGIAVAAALMAGIVYTRAHFDHEAAVESMNRGELRVARVKLRKYLKVHSHDDQARLLLAEALVTDGALVAEDSAFDALEQLGRIRDESPVAAEARLRAARLQLFILNEASTAEDSLAASVALAPDSHEAHYISWRLLGLTGRADFCEPHFWGTFESGPIEQRGARLREWYMSQFAPRTSNIDLDRRMGFLGVTEPASPQAELRRLNSFRSRQADSAVLQAAVARWYLNEGVPRRALTVLQETVDSANGLESPFFVVTLIAVHMELGNFDEAGQYFDQWPKPREGFEYWKWAGHIADEVRRDRESAAAAFDKALAIWPGPVDWSLRFRRAQCLARTGKSEEAASERARAAEIEKLMEKDVHLKIRNALSQLDNPQELGTLVEFYRALQRPREVKAWTEYIESLRQ
ncbi:MAG: hypothetical protein CMJ78_03780 [Planctomycetaceae bacterium]|nr:hypothetical protein [Planctomycetaceae bacterium]